MKNTKLSLAYLLQEFHRYKLYKILVTYPAKQEKKRSKAYLESRLHNIPSTEWVKTLKDNGKYPDDRLRTARIDGLIVGIQNRFMEYLTNDK